MGKVKGKHRLDKFYHLAKEQGYRSRAAFKLIQLDSKFSFLHSARAVLDLCAAPGGWMQVAVQRAPVGALVLGLDLFHIRPIRGAISAEEDITKPKCRATIKRILGENGVKGFDVVLHDGSPNVGGAWAQEATSQNALVVDSVKLATEFLAPKGVFVTKVFRSQDYNAVLYCLKQLFEKVEVTKPVASRSTSAEIYVVGLRYKAPAKIDPRLLDVRHLFEGGAEPQKNVVDVLRETKRKRHRDGYEEGAAILRKVCSAADFVWSDAPLEILGTVTSINFEDPASLPIKNHNSTTEEVKALCDDLRVLGKQDFKHLLKWRLNIRKDLSSTEKVPSVSMDDEGNNDAGKEDQDEDEKILNEMEELTTAVERKNKRAKKLLAKRRAKDKARKATGMQIDATQDGYVDNELFSLASIKGKKDLVALDTTEDTDEVGEIDGDGDEENNVADEDEESSDLDSDEERKRYDEQIEELLDAAYERFVAKKEGSTKQRKRAKKIYADGKFQEDDDQDDMIQSEDDSDKDDGDLEANPLVVPISEERAPTQEENMQTWYSQDIFAEALEDGDLHIEDSDDEPEVTIHEHITSPPNKAKVGPTSSPVDLDAPKKALKTEDDFEIVAAPTTVSSDSSSSDDESDEDDIDSKAEILAYAKKMLRKKQRNQIIDDAYNKYMFDDEGLPDWFVEEEQKHCQPIKPVTKEEIMAMKAQFKEINARPAKKVAEAKARKKRTVQRKLEKIRKKANSISDQTDIPDRSKRRMIEQLYKKATPEKPKKEYVVAKKGVQVRAGKGKVLVDRRMKKDARVRGMNKEGGKGKKGKGNGKGKGKKPKGPAKASTKTRTR